MKQLNYFTGICFSLLLSACDMESSTEQAETAGAESDLLSSDVAEAVTQSESASPYYALRPVDDTWPAINEETAISQNLLAANYYIVLDGSGSMEGDNCAAGTKKMTVAKTAISQFAQQIPVDANVALYSFDAQGSGQRVALASNNREQIFNQVSAIQPGGVTPLATALSYGFQQLQIQAAKQLGYGEYHLVVVTDGIATANEIPDQVVQTILQKSPVVIHSVGFCLDENHSLNQPGRTFYTAASNAEELQQGLQAVLAESTDFSSDTF